MNEEFKQETVKTSLTEIEGLSFEDKVKILRAPLPAINFIKPTKSTAGITPYKSQDRKLDE